MAVQTITQKTYLQLLTRAMKEAGVQQVDPSSVDDTDGLVPRFKDWINQSFEDIQREQDWLWRRSQLEFTLTSTNDTYSLQTNDNADVNGLIAHFSDSTRPYMLVRVLEVSENTASTEQQDRCYFVPYQDWRGEQTRLVTKTAGQPTYFTILPSKVIQFNRPADDDYGFDVDYLTEVVEMTADADVPTIPKKYQDMIIWRAVAYYGGFDKDNPVIGRAMRRYRTFMKRMYEEQLPPMRFKPTPLYREAT